MTDKMKLVLENVELTEQGLSGFTRFATVKNDKNSFVFKRYISFNVQNDCEKFENIECWDENKKNKAYKISLTLIRNMKHDTNKLYIEGNLRKWFFGSNNISDLNKKNFCSVIRILSARIGIEENVLWNAKVTKLETGVTIKLKDEHRAIFNCIFGYKAFSKNTYDNTGVEFKGENYDLIFYDMLRRVFNKKDKLERSYRKLSKNNFLVRFEIQGHKVSGMNMFKDKADTLLKIKNNWKYLGQNLLDTLDKLDFVDTISPSIYVDIKGGTKSKMSNYLIYRGIKEIGLENVRQLIEQMNSKKRTEYRKDFIALYEEHLVKDRQNFEVIFRQKVKKKISLL